MAIHAVPSDCSSTPSTGQLGAVEGADVVQAQEAALEQVVALDVLAVDPPVEVEQQLVQHPRQEVEVVVAGDLVHPQRRPRLDRRVDVGEVPLVGGQLAVGVHVPLAAEQDELGLGELGVDVGQRDAVEGQVPGGVPRVLPLVGHRDDVAVVEVRPLVVAAREALGRRRRVGRVARPASGARRSGRTAWTTAVRRTPGAGSAPRPARPRPGSARRRRRRPRARGRP